MTNIQAYQQTLEHRLLRAERALADAELAYRHAPQMRDARQRGPHPDVHHAFIKRAAQARSGAWAMWLLCIVLGGIFTVMSYAIPGLADWASALTVLLIWIVLTVLIGIAAEKVVQFGLHIHADAPLSVRKAVRGIWLAGAVFLLSFAGLLVLRTVINLPALIVLQAVFEVSDICAGAFFRALSNYYGELPELRARMAEIEDEIGQLKAEMAMLAQEEQHAPIPNYPQASPRQFPYLTPRPARRPARPPYEQKEGTS